MPNPDPLHQQAEALATEIRSAPLGGRNGMSISGRIALEALQQVQAETREEDAQQVESVQPTAGCDCAEDIYFRKGELFMRKVAAAAIRARKDRP